MVAIFSTEFEVVAKDNGRRSVNCMINVRTIKVKKRIHGMPKMAGELIFVLAPWLGVNVNGSVWSLEFVWKRSMSTLKASFS